MITTTKGLMDEALLRKVDGAVDDENEHTTWIEYWHGDELVHRSAHVRLKRGVEAQVVLGEVNG